MHAIKWIFASIAVVCLGAGCQTGQLVDPNSAAEIGTRPEVIRRNLLDYRETLQDRALKGQIKPTDVNKMVAERAKEMLKDVDEANISAENAWQYADAYRQAEDWQKAMDLLDAARKQAVSEDRRVNDTLQYARCAAHLGKVPEAVAAARESFTAKPSEKAPILPAVFFEIVPEGRGKKHDEDLAALLEEAITQHTLVEVDPATEAGKAFLQAKPFHIGNAWGAVIKLYQDAGNDEMAREAVKRRDTMVERFGSA